MKGFPPRETGGPVEVASRIVRELLRDPANRIGLIVQTDSSVEEIRATLEPAGELGILKLPYYPSMEDLWTLPRVNEMFRRAEIVHFNEFPFRHMPYLLLARLHGRPLVFTLHGRLSEEAASFLGASYPVRILGGRGTFELRLPRLAIRTLVGIYRRTNRLWSALVVNSEATLRGATRSDGFSPEIAHVLPNGVDIPDPPPGPPEPHDGPPRILFVGKLEEVKGPDLLFGALERMAARGHALDVTVAGAGSLEPTLRAWAQRMPTHRIHILGGVPHDEALRLMTRVDAVVVPSRYESFPLVILEAMAAARPLVATAVGGIPEILRPTENAYLSDPDPAALAQALDEFLAHPAAWSVMGARNAEAARTRTWPAVAALYVALYRSLLASPRNA